MISEGKYVTEYYEKVLKRSFEAGDKSTLLWTIYACLDLGRPIPEWTRAAFLEAYEAADRFEIRSWEEVFGRPVPKSMHLQPNMRNAQLRWRVIERVQALRAEAWKVNNDLFNQVAQDLKISSGALAREIYYANRSRKPRK
jgi:hypothetical protein